MTTDLTPEELAGLRERVMSGIHIRDDEGLHLLSQLQREAERVPELERAAEDWCLAAMVGLEAYDASKGERPDYIGKAAKALAAEQERAARYREALEGFVCFDHKFGSLTNDAICATYPDVRYACKAARAALAEPKEAQQDRGLLFGARSIAEENMRLAEWEAAGRPRTEPEEAQHGDD